MDDKILKNKIALVTGGSNGIGAATVQMLSQAGATVLIGYYNGKNRANELLKNISGNNHQIIQIKLEDSESILEVYREVKSSFGKLDILVNSAGFTKPIPHKNLEKLDEKL